MTSSVTWPLDSQGAVSLLVVNMNRPCISPGCWDIELQTYRGHDLDLFGSRDVICHVTIGFAIWGSYKWSIWTNRLSRAVFEILSFKHIVVTTLTFGSSDVIGHVIIGFSRCGFLLVVNMNRPCKSHGSWDIEIQRFWCHDLDLLGHVTSWVTWPLDSSCAVSYRWSFETIALSRIVVEILCVKHLAKHIPVENALIPIFVF